MRRRSIVAPSLVALAAGLIPLAGCGGSGDDAGAGEAPGDAGTEATSTGEVVDTPSGELAANFPAGVEVSAQSGDGASMVVDRVELPHPGWVLILDPAEPVIGELGRVVGVSDALAAGVSEDVVVALDPPLETSGTLFAEPHVDSNLNGVLEWDPVAGPVVDQSAVAEQGDAIKVFGEIPYRVE
jgi:hypothetical protein